MMGSLGSYAWFPQRARCSWEYALAGKPFPRTTLSELLGLILCQDLISFGPVDLSSGGGNHEETSCLAYPNGAWSP